MKRILLSMMTLGAISMMAQSSSEYVPLVREGVKWDCEMLFYRADDRLFVYPYTIEFRGDTTIDGNTYKKCYYFFDGHTQEESDSTLRAFVREDIATRQVWALNNANFLSNDDVASYWSTCSYLTSPTEPILIYDFSNPTSTNIQCVEKWLDCVGDATISVETDSIEIAGQTSKRFTISIDQDANYYAPKSMSFVEGIGYTECDPAHFGGELLNPFSMDMIPDVHTWATQFLRMRDAEGEVIYSTPNYPESSYTPLVREGVSWECAIHYDSWGRVTKEYPYTIKFQGDTVIDGNTYKKCYQLFDDYNQEVCDATLMAFVRENNATRQVWALPNKNYQSPIQGCFPWYYTYDSMDEPTSEVLLYDFYNVTSADVHRVGAYFSDTDVTHIVENVVIDSIRTRRHTLKSDSNELHLIEGIGFADAYGDLFNLFSYDPTPNGTSYEPKFYRMRNAAGEVIYSTSADVESDYNPLLQEGQSWEGALCYTNTLTNESAVIPYTIKIKGDTIQNGLEYKKCYYYWNNDTTIEDNSTLRALIAENDFYRMVYVIPNANFQNNNEIIQSYVEYLNMYNEYQNGVPREQYLYIFHKEDLTLYGVRAIGLPTDVTDNVTVDTITTLDGAKRERFISEHYNGLTAIEGLGYVNESPLWGDLLDPYHVETDNGISYHPIIYRVKNAAGEVIYRTNYDKDNSVSSIIADESIATIDIYNIQGVLLMQGVAPAAVNNLDAGLYIVKSYNAAGDSVKTSKVIIGK